MTILNVETQFVVELPEHLRPLVDQYNAEVTTSLGLALGILFGLALGTPVRVSARFTNRFQLVEVNGVTNRVATFDELTGCFVGVQATLVNLLLADSHAIPLDHERVTDA